LGSLQCAESSSCVSAAELKNAAKHSVAVAPRMHVQSRLLRRTPRTRNITAPSRFPGGRKLSDSKKNDEEKEMTQNMTPRLAVAQT
jgi:hypothetical protein